MTANPEGNAVNPRHCQRVSRTNPSKRQDPEAMTVCGMRNGKGRCPRWTAPGGMIRGVRPTRRRSKACPVIQWHRAPVSVLTGKN
jgi:hypothetical protein